MAITEVRDREITAVVVIVLTVVILGTIPNFADFFFPDFGESIEKVAGFYAPIIVAAIALFALKAAFRGGVLPIIPPVYIVVLNFLIFFMIFYPILYFLINGNINVIKLPSLQSFAEQGIVTNVENILAFIIFPYLMPWGNGVGDARGFKLPWRILPISIGDRKFPFRDYNLTFNPPNINRFKYGLISITLIILLHAKAYSYLTSSVTGFYTLLGIATILFGIMWYVRESFGFGACVAFHLAWNLTLITLTGSII